MIYIAADHGGFKLKEELIKYLTDSGLEFEDLGPYELVENDDYPDYMLKLIERIRANEGSRGVILCRNGVGVSMLVNKFKGIRAGLTWNAKHAISMRNDDNTNVLALPADYVDSAAAKEILQIWLDTQFSNDERHARRLNKVELYGQE